MTLLERIRERLKVGLTRFPRLYDGLRRPYVLSRFLLRRPHDSEYRVFSLFSYRQGMFLDVGANAGMSALSFRIYNRRSPIVSIEPNVFHERDLRFVSRLARPFAYLLLGAGERDGSETLYVPVYRGVPLTTEASLIESEVRHSLSLRARLGARMDSDAFCIVARTVVVKRLDALGLRPAFIKLDVQGAEHQALRGLERTLDAARPILLVESPGPEVRAWLGARNYAAFRYLTGENRLSERLTGALNVVFVPAEELARIEPGSRGPAPEPAAGPPTATIHT